MVERLQLGHVALEGLCVLRFDAGVYRQFQRGAYKRNLQSELRDAGAQTAVETALTRGLQLRFRQIQVLEWRDELKTGHQFLERRGISIKQRQVRRVTAPELNVGSLTLMSLTSAVAFAPSNCGASNIPCSLCSKCEKAVTLGT